jgi:radical SAM protein with 4Fe4S-binding SPASM domain
MVAPQSDPSSAETRQCTSPWDHIFVNKDGQVLPCCNSAVWEESSTDGQNVMGDLSSQSFSEVWRGEKFRRFRRDLLEGPIPSICRTCTVTSTGTHPFKLYSARLEPRPWWKPGHRLQLVVRNSGTSTWTKKTQLHVGTSAPRDRISSWHHRSWLNANRIATFSEEQVRPGERAHFELTVSPEEADLREVFELVVEGVCWLPNTRFSIRRRRSWAGAERLEIQPAASAASPG